MKLQTLCLGFIFSVAHAQNDGNDNNDNLSMDIQSCSDLSCIDNSTGVCQIDRIRAVGVGIAGEVIRVNDTDLSLTLVDGGPDGVLAGSRGYQFSTQTCMYYMEQSFPKSKADSIDPVYVGIPQSFAIQDQSIGCALMAQYQGSTFPDRDNEINSNTTSCGNTIPDFCRKNIAETIQEFQFNGTNQSMGRCEALTQYVSISIRRDLTFCGSWLAGFTNVTGGTFFGPDASSEATELQSDGCQPVLPEERSLYKVAEMAQLLYAGDEESLQPAEDVDEDDQRPLMGARRSGITPVVTVLYNGSGDGSPDVQFACMRTFAADGGGIPDTLNFESSAGVNLLNRWMAGVVAASMLLVIV